MAKIGIQIYTVRQLASTNLTGAINLISTAGYDGIEFDAGMIRRVEPAALKTLMDNLRLEVIGLTVLMHELEHSLEPMIDYACMTGAQWLVMPWIDEISRKNENDYKIIAQTLNKAGYKAKNYGLRFAYHIHGYEFDAIGDTRGIDVLIETLDPDLVELQLDTFWVASAGIDCVAFSKKYLNRIGSFHIKDVAGENPLKDIEVGNGILDLQGIIKLGLERDVDWFIVEQEESDLPLPESIRISLQNLRLILGGSKKTPHQHSN